MRMPALGPAVMVPVGVKVTVTVVATLLTGLPSVMARFTKGLKICGNVPIVVASIIVGDTADKSLEVPAATVVSAACALFGVVNCWKCKLIGVFAENVPAVNRIFSTLVLTMLGVHAGELVAPVVN